MLDEMLMNFWFEKRNAGQKRKAADAAFPSGVPARKLPVMHPRAHIS
jgi:hypothetical protein